MVLTQTKLRIVDNSGAKVIRVFHLFKYPLRPRLSSVGDVVLGSVFKYRSNKKVVKKQSYRVLIVTAKRNVGRRNGMHIRFDETRGVVVSATYKLLGTRIFGPISKVVKYGVTTRLASLAYNVI